MPRHLLLLSNSTLYGSTFMEWGSEIIIEFLNNKNVKEVLFIPYAGKNHDQYTETAQKAFRGFGYALSGIHTHENQIAAIDTAQAIFVGGGNTFRLLKSLYDYQIIHPIRRRVLMDGIPYIGSSAGTNVATVSINTTNDMPIVYPPSFEALGLVPFNINPHFMDDFPNSKHMGETRETRIKEYHEEADTPVLGLREGSLLHVDNENATLRGLHPARLFSRDKDPIEFPVCANLSFLLTA